MSDTTPKFTRTPDCSDTYANNVQFEPSIWDLKMIFGRLNQGTGDVVEQYATVAIPWKLAKLISYYLQIQVAAHEADSGRLTLPPSLWPPQPALVEAMRDDPRAKEWLEFARELHEALIIDLTKAATQPVKQTGFGSLPFIVQ